MPANKTRKKAKKKTRAKSVRNARKVRQQKRLEAIRRKNKTSDRLPYEKVYIRSKKCYSVRRKNKKNPRVFSKCTSKEKATKQLRLLSALLYNPNFVRIR
jgi:hypothetical protein